MYFSTLCGVAAASLALVSATPIQKRYNTYTITFIGAAGAQYSVPVPFDGQSHDTGNALSISSVSAPSPVNIAAQCVLDTVDFPPALVNQGNGVWTVGPPQTVLSISCTESSSPSPPPSTDYVTIEFDGADPSLGAKFSLQIPLDGAAHNVNNALSISAVVETYGSIDLSTNCKFVGVDSNKGGAAAPALAPAGSNRWQVGPPQTILSVACFLHANPGH